MLVKLSIAVIFLLICTRSSGSSFPSEIHVEDLWESANSGGWRPSSAPRFDWPPPPKETNGYLRVRCNGGFNQQRIAICNAVLAARIMNATLVLPELDANSFWHEDSGFHDIYDVEHFVQSLRYDVRIVESIPEFRENAEKIESLELWPPIDAPIRWYTTVALEKMKQHGAIYLTPFSHHLAEEIDNAEYRRLRCRVNYHALRFKPQIMELSESIIDKLQAQGRFMAIHLPFEIDMLEFFGCFNIFTHAEIKTLMKKYLYRKYDFVPIYGDRKSKRKCLLTPEEVGLMLRAMGFDNSTRVYLSAGELFGGERFVKPFKALFPCHENHNSVEARNTPGLLESAVGYMVFLLADIFVFTNDGPRNFANNLPGHRLYSGFWTTIRPDTKGLAPIFFDRKNGRRAGFEEAVRRVMLKTNFGGPHKRVAPESFYTNPWPECFCQTDAQDPAHKCPPENVLQILEIRIESEVTSDLEYLDQCF
ncbi:O-fucosyltransferase 1 isoform X2 [Jatropha curcas]|nr:O-fucosyltransferase 1 isoform X2 [Jatropha curcas]